MKKILTVLLTLIICFTLTGCSCAKNNTEPTQTSSPISSEKDIGGEYPDNWD